MDDCGLLFCYAETAVHAGGPDSVGVLDLPVQRESTTRLPTIWGQSTKGALRDHAGQDPARWPDLEAVFGSAPPGTTGAGTGPPRPGWLAVGDLRLVAFPVPTLAHTFAWATSPLLLARQARLADVAGVTGVPGVPHVDDGHVVAPSAGRWWAAEGERVAVGEYDLVADPASVDLAAWARWFADNGLPRPPRDGVDPFAFFRQKLAMDLLLVADELLGELTEEHAEVVPRVQLEDDSKTVRHGPWYTEYLPAETILCAPLRCCSPAGQLAGLGSRLDGEVLVAGGDETVGKGLMWMRWQAGAA